MTIKVFIDTNVLLDVLAERMPFYPDSMRVWTLAESGRIEAFVGAISFNNIRRVRSIIDNASFRWRGRHRFCIGIEWEGGPMKRREFLAASTVVGPALAGGAVASEEKPTEPAGELAILSQLVSQQYGELLSEEQVAEVCRQIAGDLATAQLIRAVPLSNSDEPVLAPSAIYRLEDR